MSKLCPGCGVELQNLDVVTCQNCGNGIIDELAIKIRSQPFNVKYDSILIKNIKTLFHQRKPGFWYIFASTIGFALTKITWGRFVFKNTKFCIQAKTFFHQHKPDVWYAFAVILGLATFGILVYHCFLSFSFADPDDMGVIFATIQGFALNLASFFANPGAFADPNEMVVIFAAIQAFALILSAIFIISQLHGTKNVARANFISSLNKSYVENKTFVDLYDKLHKCQADDCRKCGSVEFNIKDRSTHCKLEAEIPISTITNYLTFFETIYLLKKDNVISFKYFDNLFAYRFFFAVHSKLFQQTKLFDRKVDYKEIFCLEYEWLKYRESIGKSNEMYISSKKDYVSLEEYLPLKELFESDEEYQQLIVDCIKE